MYCVGCGGGLGKALSVGESFMPVMPPLMRQRRIVRISVGSVASGHDVGFTRRGPLGAILVTMV
jgi:hypothetical protein